MAAMTRALILATLLTLGGCEQHKAATDAPCDILAYDFATGDSARKLSGLPDGSLAAASPAHIALLRAWATKQTDKCASDAYSGWANYYSEARESYPDAVRKAQERGNAIAKTLPQP